MYVLRVRRGVMISTEQVTCFTAAYELKSYSAASIKLGKARSTVRERINNLEILMGEQLFTIEGKKAIPTDVAKRLYPRARLLARQALEFENIAMSAYKGEISNVTIYHDSSTPTTLILAIENAIKSRFKDITINWLQRDRNQCLERIESGEAFMAIMPGLGNLHPSIGIGNVNLGTLELKVYTSVESTIPTSLVSINELATELQLISENDFANQLRHTKLSSEYEIVTSQYLLFSKLRLNGWTVAPESEALPYVKRGEIREVELIEAPLNIRQDLIMFYNMSSELSERESKLISTVIQVCKKLQQ